MPYEWREEIYEAIRYVDRVVRQDSRDPTENLRIFRPDVLFHGADWDEIPGTAFMEEIGGTVVKTPYPMGDVSTTKLMDAVQKGVSMKAGKRKKEKVCILILAGGIHRRGWTAENPKELAKIEGQPLLLRTLGQLKRLGYSATVVSGYRKVRELVKNCVVPNDTQSWSAGLYSTRSLWTDKTVVLNGDIIFSERLLKRILAEDRPIQFHGRPGSAFAVVFKRQMHSEVIAALEIAIADFKKLGVVRDSGLIWQFYRAVCGDDLHPEHHDNTKFYTLASRKKYPQDIDSVEDYKRFLKNHAWARDV